MAQQVPGFETRRINETATRARAGILNVISATTVLILVFQPSLDPVRYVGPFVIFDMFAAAALGLTPLSPVGIIGTAITLRLRPVWKPAPPKRFAWVLGGLLGVGCLSLRIFGAPTGWIIAVVSTCFVLTWLEVALGFCVGCWIYGKLRACEDCELPYVRQ